MLLARKLRDLTLQAPSGPGRPPFLSAASGLVVVQSSFHVIADDELHLGVFPVRGNATGRLIRLLEGKLPEGPKKRKRKKPDFEALVLLPPFGTCSHGALLAIGSGSKGNRRTAVLLTLTAQGAVAGEPRVIDLSGLLSSLQDALDEVNIEGALVVGDRLLLIQRGNRGRAVNAVLSVELNVFLLALESGDSVGELPFDFRSVDLGSTRGIPWGFTDASALPDGRIVFTAVAEDTADSYVDGPCAGAAVGILTRDGQIVRFDELQPTIKVEGIHAEPTGSRIRLLLVTDADDAAVPAGLWEAEIG